MSVVTLQQWINGAWLPGTGEELHSHNPANGKIISRFQCSNDHDIEMAVQAAHHVSPDWANTSLEYRSAICQRFVELLTAEQKDFALLISEENGKQLWESELEVAAMISKYKISLQAFQQRTGDTTTALNHITLQVRHKPLGVIAVLGPFNFPGHIPNGQIIPALLAGNTIVFKPSEQTPTVAVNYCRLWETAGLPPGVLNLVLGNAAVGKTLLKQDIQAVFFTGSYATGKAIHQHFAGRVDVLLALEMGGNNPLIFPRLRPIGRARPEDCRSHRARRRGRRLQSGDRRLLQNGRLSPRRLINYLALLGWSWDDKAEHFSRPELIEKFSLERVNKSPASFDPKKLAAFEDWHFQQLPLAQKVALVTPFLEQAKLIHSPPSADEKLQVENHHGGGRPDQGGRRHPGLRRFLPRRQAIAVR